MFPAQIKYEEFQASIPVLFGFFLLIDFFFEFVNSKLDVLVPSLQNSIMMQKYKSIS